MTSVRRAWGPRDPLAWLLLLAIWLLAHPYTGIRHDAVFYAVDALRRLDVAAYESDIFFLNGSPFKASVFGWAYSALVDRLGLVPAAWVSYLAGQLLWAVAAIAWCVRFVPARVFAVASALLILLPHAYGDGQVLKLAEFQVTARSFSEPLTLLGLLLVAVGRCGSGFATLALAAAIHPIMALPGWIAAAWLVTGQYGLKAHSRIALASAGFALIGAIAAAGGFGFMDDGWLAATALRNPFILAREWSGAYVARVCAPILVLAAASRILDGRRGALCAAVAVAALSGLLLTLLGDTQRAALILQAQPWRAVWLAFWLAPIAALAAGARLWREDRGRALMMLCAIPASALSYFALVPGIAWLPALHAAMLHFCFGSSCRRRWGTVGRVWLAVLIPSLVVNMAAIPYAIAFHGDRFKLAEIVSTHEQLARFVGWLLAPLLVLLVVRAHGPTGVPVSGTTKVPAGARILGWALTCILLGSSFALIDARSQPMKRDEARMASGMPELASALGDARVIFWPERLDLVWLGLRRAAYVSNAQMAAQMFNAEISAEGRRRLALLGALGGYDGLLSFKEVRSASAPLPKPDSDAVARICADSPGLALVLPWPVAWPMISTVRLGDGEELWVAHCSAPGSQARAVPSLTEMSFPSSIAVDLHRPMTVQRMQ